MNVTHPNTHLKVMATLQQPERQLSEVETLMYTLTSAKDARDVVSAAARHHFKAGGGRTRAKLGLAAARHLALLPQQAVALATVAELLHNASLIHDDIQDKTPSRRGRLAVWAKYGSDVAILVGDLMVSAAYAVLASFPDPAAMAPLLRRTHERTREVICGQAREIGRAHV